MTRKSLAKLDRWSTPVCFVLLCGILLFRRSMGYGLAIGWMGIAVTVASVWVAVFICSNAVHLLVRARPDTLAKLIARYATISASSFVLAALIFMGLDSDASLHTYLFQSKVEYFCGTHFDHALCVENVNLCPRCTLKIDRYKRQAMYQNLKASDERRMQQASAAAKPPPERTPANQ